MDDKVKKTLGILAILGMVGAFFGGFFFSKTMYNTKNIGKKEDNELTEIINLIKKNYYLDVSDEEIKDAYLKGLVDELCDPFSHVSINNSAKKLGYGFNVSYDYKISNINESSTAFKNGIRVNDTLLGINDKYFKTNNKSIVLNEVSYKENDKVIFHLKRNDYLFDVELSPEKLEEKNISSKMYNKIGYIKLNEFSNNCANEFIDELHTLEANNLEGLVIDMRNNPGGLVDEAIKILREFLTGNDYFLAMESKKTKDFTDYYRPIKNTAKNYDIKILINEYTASSAEIFALAMNRVMNYDLIGTNTFGKGVYQNVISLESNTTKTLSITVGSWYGSNMESISGVGIKPTIEITEDETYYVYEGCNDTYTLDMASIDIKNTELMLKYLGYSTRVDGYFDNNLKNILYTNYASNEINKEIQKQIYDDFTNKYYSTNNDTILDSALKLF